MCNDHKVERSSGPFGHLGKKQDKREFFIHYFQKLKQKNLKATKKKKKDRKSSHTVCLTVTRNMLVICQPSDYTYFDLISRFQ